MSQSADVSVPKIEYITLRRMKMRNRSVVVRECRKVEPEYIPHKHRTRMIPLSFRKSVLEIGLHRKKWAIIALYKAFNREQILAYFTRAYPDHGCTTKIPKLKIDLIKEYLKYDDPLDEEENPDIKEILNSYTWHQRTHLYGPYHL